MIQIFSAVFVYLTTVLILLVIIKQDHNVPILMLVRSQFLPALVWQRITHEVYIPQFLELCKVSLFYITYFSVIEYHALDIFEQFWIVKHFPKIRIIDILFKHIVNSLYKLKVCFLFDIFCFDYLLEKLERHNIVNFIKVLFRTRIGSNWVSNIMNACWTEL